MVDTAAAHRCNPAVTGWSSLSHDSQIKIIEVTRLKLKTSYSGRLMKFSKIVYFSFKQLMKVVTSDNSSLLVLEA